MTNSDFIYFLKQLDTSLFIFINQTIHNTLLDFLMPFVRNKYTWAPAYFFLIFLYYKKYKINSIYPISFLIICFALTDSISYQILKPYFDRVRPCYNELIQVRLLVKNCGNQWSFPSIHAANHFGLSLGIILTNLFTKKIWNFVILFWAIIIGFAQIYVGLHYPFDVLGGFLFGGLITYTLYKITKYFYVAKQKI